MFEGDTVEVNREMSFERSKGCTGNSSIIAVLSVFFVCLVLSCGKAVSDAQNFTPNKPPSITGITATNVDGSAVNKSKILSFAVYNVTVTASDPDNRSLAYSFRSSCGSFKNLCKTATGCTVQFVTGSISGGTEVRITVQAADMHGGTAGGSIDVGTGKLGPSISVTASKDHVRSVDDVILSVRSNCDGIFQIHTDRDGVYSENTPINNDDDVMIYDGDVADVLVSGPKSITGGWIAHLPSISGRSVGDYNDTYPVWVVFRDSLKQTTAVKCPVIVDDIKPHVVSWSPANGSVKVSQTPTIAVVFDEDIDPATLQGALSVTSVDGNGTVGVPSYDAGTHTARYPVTGLAALSAKPYTALIANSVTDIAGNALDSANGSIAFCTGTNEPGSAQWATLPGSVSNSSYFNGVATDGAGNTYAVGYIYGNGSFNFGGSSTPINGLYALSANAVIVKYDSSGVCQWAKTLTSAPGESCFNRVAVDGSGNIYVVGYVYSPSLLASYSFGNGQSITCKIYNDNPVVVKYNASGVCQWVKTLTSGTVSGNCTFNDVVADASVVYVAGSIYGQYSYGFDSHEVTGAYNGDDNALIVKFDSGTGTCQWAKTTNSAFRQSYFSGIAVGYSGVYAVGVIAFTGSYDFGSGSINGPFSNYNSVIVKYDMSGVCQWAKTLTAAPGGSVYSGVATDADDNAYAVGFIMLSGSFNFGNSKIINTDAPGISSGINSAIVKYDSSGACHWAKTLVDSSGNNQFTGIVRSSTGLYITGNINGNGLFKFGSFQSTQMKGPYAGDNAVMLKYSLSGECQWATTLVSASNSSTFEGIAADSSGGVYAAGWVKGLGSYNFGGITPILTGLNNDSTPFIVKYQQ